MADKALSWFARGPFQGMEESAFVFAIERAFAYWEACCGLRFIREANISQAQVVLFQGPLYPAPHGLGVMSGHPNQWPVSLVFYATPKWVVGKRRNLDELDPIRIIAHEIGHAILGPEHLPAGNLMAESYVTMAKSPQEADILLAMRKYGEPAEVAA